MIASFYEVYNENVYDLMDGNKTPLSVRHNTAQNVFYVPGLVELECRNVDDVAAVVAEGRRARRRAAHKLNRDSSRGHALLSLKLVGVHKRNLGKVNFVDLAGNERLGRSQTENAAETGSINRSLFALGKVISSLSQDDADRDHVPYRDSTLTKLLMDSLGGDVFTLMIACVSPAPAHLDETLCTLQYAYRAKGITNTPSVQLVAAAPTDGDQDDELATLRSENARLREENHRLRFGQPRAGPPSTISNDDDASSVFAPNDGPRARGVYEFRHSARSRPSDSSRGSDGRQADNRVDYLDSKIDRLAEHFTTLEAKLDAASATKIELDAFRRHQEHQQQWHQAQWQAAYAAQQQQHQQQALYAHQQTQGAFIEGSMSPGSVQQHYSPSSSASAHRADSALQQRRRTTPTESHLCAVHRQSTGDVVRRHREGIGI